MKTVFIVADNEEQFNAYLDETGIDPETAEFFADKEEANGRLSDNLKRGVDSRILDIRRDV